MEYVSELGRKFGEDGSDAGLGVAALCDDCGGG